MRIVHMAKKTKAPRTPEADAMLQQLWDECVKEDAAMTPAERLAKDLDRDRVQREENLAEKPDADNGLVLTRITVPRYQTVTWWLLNPGADWRDLAFNYVNRGA